MNYQLKTRLFRKVRKGSSRGNDGFTLLQVMSALGVLLIIASIAGVAFSSYMDKAKAATCEANLKVLNSAVELYTQEYGVFPAILGELKPQHLQKAYARFMEESSWYTRFSIAFLKITPSGKAHAEFLNYNNLRKFGAAQDSFTCPADDNGGTSYGINANLAGQPWTTISNDLVIVADCDSPTFTNASQLKERHSSGNVAIAITKGGAVAKFGDDTGDNSDVAFYETAVVAGDAQAIIDAVLANDLYTATRQEALQNRINTAIGLIEAGDNAAAIEKLTLFTDNVQTDIADGKIDAANGNSLIDMANGVIGMIGG